MVDLVVNNEKIKNIELAIFDKDGTLMDLYMYWASMIDLRASFVQKELGLTEGQKKDVMYELIIEEIQEMHEAISDITGRDVNENAIDKVFKEFCVGK